MQPVQGPVVLREPLVRPAQELLAQLEQQALTELLVLALQVRQELRGPELQVPRAPRAQEYLVLQVLQVQEQQAPRDRRDFLLASLTTTHAQRQQVVTQAMDLFCGIMLHKLMLHNYWLAT